MESALLKLSDLIAKVAANITTPDIPPPLLAGIEDPPIITPVLALASPPSTPQYDKKKGKAPASSSFAKNSRIRAPSSALALASNPSDAPEEVKLPAFNPDTSSPFERLKPSYPSRLYSFRPLVECKAFLESFYQRKDLELISSWLHSSVTDALLRFEGILFLAALISSFLSSFRVSLMLEFLQSFLMDF